MAQELSILILPSEDGQDYAHAILYPAEWSPETACRKAVRAFRVGQRDNPEEWSWDDIEPHLREEGFTLANWTHGPCWDCGRIEEKDEPESGQ